MVTKEQFEKMCDARNILCNFCENTDFCERCQVTLLIDQAEAECSKDNEGEILWVGYNEAESFRILICANDSSEALKLAEEYAEDADLKGSFIVTKTNKNLCQGLNFDCDYIVEDGNEDIRYVDEVLDEEV
jgi:hypothetical protein